MKFICVDLLLDVVKEQGIDPVYAVLERLYLEEPLVFVNADGEAVFVPYDPMEIWDFLEALQEKLNLEEV